VLKDGKPFLVTGSPGGSRIITTVLQVIVDVIDHHLGIDDAVALPRLHHQWLPDEVAVEPGMPAATLQRLAVLGHTLRISAPPTSANSIAATAAGWAGAADPRTRGALAAGY
jgi:gamma-glutamyltranspeptidase / glutathione hydrolase